MVSESVTQASVLDSYRQLMHALHADRSRLAEPWHDCPMTMPQLRALSLIAANDGGLSSRDLAVTLGVGASAITPLVDRLVEHGFVCRTEDAHDRRIARLHTTQNGAAMLDRMLEGRDDLLCDALAQLSPAQLQSVGTALDVLRTAVHHHKETTA